MAKTVAPVDCDIELEQLEEELKGGRREFTGQMLAVISIIAAAFSAFYLYTSAVGQFNPQTHRGLYILFTYVLCFLLYPFGKNPPGGGLRRWIGCWSRLRWPASDTIFSIIQKWPTVPG